jgi:hypothetical protein
MTLQDAIKELRDQVKELEEFKIKIEAMRAEKKVEK